MPRWSNLFKITKISIKRMKRKLVFFSECEKFIKKSSAEQNKTHFIFYAENRVKEFFSLCVNN